MKAYVFVNRYLSGVQVGIQAAHALVRLGVDNSDNDFYDWATEHETIVVLNGGSSSNMKNILNILSGGDNRVEYFREPDMDDMITAIAYVPSKKEFNQIEELRLIPYTNDVSDVVYLISSSHTHRG